ncbi:MAG: aspartate--ammonia ligase [Clostridia bacterium]|nr:aspartate--ammonia ligase [Clostridia bacterium]
MYKPKLDVLTTQSAIRMLRHKFEENLCDALNLRRVSAPLFVKENSGLNDNLNGVERPVRFDVLQTGEELEIVHSLAKWKRYALSRYNFQLHTGLYSDMNAIRRDETVDSIHSIYVDQWDWEKIIEREDRTREYLEDTVNRIYSAILMTADYIEREYPALINYFPRQIKFITTEELLKMYPDLSPKEREDAAAKKWGAVFIIGIGDKLSNGEPHDLRAPDYDDWELNGDILIYNKITKKAFEVSSMGIRVDEKSLVSQLEKAGKSERLSLPFHKSLINGELPLTIGGGIGQSRLCMLLLQKAHIGEVQASYWPEEEIEKCKAAGIELL